MRNSFHLKARKHLHESGPHLEIGTRVVPTSEYIAMCSRKAPSGGEVSGKSRLITAVVVLWDGKKWPESIARRFLRIED